MKYIILILITIVIIKSQSSCDFDNKTVQLFWKKEHLISEAFPLHRFLYYHKLKRKLESILKLNHPNIQCDIYEICNTKFSNFEKMDEACLYCEENYNYDFGNGLFYDIDLELDDIDLSGSDKELDVESYSGLYYEYGVEKYSFCEMFFMFENKTKFVFLIDHLEIWVFSQRNITIHSNKFINKSAKYFFTTG